jgi:GTP-binding protein
MDESISTLEKNTEKAPLVAIVGRPNVGKSTIFNRLVGKHLAVVDDVPGVTRDRHYAPAHILDRDIILVDTGGLDPESADPMAGRIVEQIQIALEQADVIVCVLDGSSELVSADRDVVSRIRNTKKSVLFVANKADSPAKAAAAMAHYELGMETLFPVSALHGQGMAELNGALYAALPPREEHPSDLHDEGSAEDIPRIAVVGRPNAGKSSLINRILGEEKQIVDDRPGTTVDSIDTEVRHRGKSMILIDTAGVRRKRSVDRGTESLAVMQALRAIERCDVVVVLIDATTGAADQDTKIVHLAADRGRAIVFGLNKTDALDAEKRKKALGHLHDVFNFMPWAPVVSLSAKNGRGVDKLIDTALNIRSEHRKRVGTSELNRFVEEVIEKHPPPTLKGKAVRIYYVTQVKVAPPTFVAMTNFPEGVGPAYQKYIQRELRTRFGFQGVPLRVIYRARRRRDLG